MIVYLTFTIQEQKQMGHSDIGDGQMRMQNDPQGGGEENNMRRVLQYDKHKWKLRTK